MTAQTDNNQTEAEIQELLNWLKFKLDRRLKLFPNILDNPDTCHTAAAKHVRVLSGAIEILRGDRFLPHIITALINDLTNEKNFLFRIMGKRTYSYEMYEKCIDYLKKMKT